MTPPRTPGAGRRLRGAPGAVDRPLTPLLVLSAVLLLSAGLAGLSAYFVAAQQRARFEREVLDFDAQLTRRLDSYVNVLFAARALWSTGSDIDRAAFGRYVADLDVARRLPGTLNLTFARWVTPELLSTFEDDQRRGLPNFRVRPALTTAPGGVQVPITYIEPLSAVNRVAVGFDMYSESQRRAALDRARLSDQPAVTEPLQLVQDAGRPPQPAVIVYLPIWRGKALYGYICMALRLSDLMASLASETGLNVSGAGLRVQISDSSSTGGGGVLYGQNLPDAAYTSSIRLPVAGRSWLVTSSAPASFGRDWAAPAPWLVLLVGALVATFAYLSLRAQVNARRRAEEISASLALSRSSLERARAELEAMFRAMQDTAVFTDTGGLVLYANDAVQGQFGYSPQELRGQHISALHAGALPDLREPGAGGGSGIGSREGRVSTLYRRKSGSTFYGEMQRSTVLGEGGEVIGSLEVIHDISARVAAQQALQAGERRYQGVLEAVPYPLWVVDQTGETLYRNARYAQTFGEALFDTELHPDDRAALDDVWARSQAQARLLATELRLRVGEHYRYFNLVGAPITDAAGQVSEWVFSASDIHDRLQAERNALHNEERAQGVLEGMPQLVWLAGADGEVTYFNRRWHDYVGPARAEGGFLEALHPDDRPEFALRWAQARERGERFEFEHRLLGQEGGYHTFVTRSEAIRGAQGQLTEWVGTSTDIDDQVYAEWSARLLAAIGGALVGGEDPFQGGVQGSGQGSGVPGLRMALSLMNERFTSFSALWVRSVGGELFSPISQARGHVRELSLLSRPEVSAGIDQALDGSALGSLALGSSALNTPVPVVLEGEVLHGSNLSGLLLTPLRGGAGQSGEQQPTPQQPTPQQPTSQQPGAVLALGFRQPLRDRDLELAQELSSRLSVALGSAQLSRRVREAQEALRDLNASLEERVRLRTGELEEANSELEAFSYSVSHDLRTPLRHIVGFAELLQKDAGSSVSVRGQRYMGIITDAATRMGQLIDDLLEFSRMGRQELREAEVPLSGLVQEVIAELRLAAPGQAAQWDVAELPSVCGDASLLRQVLLNLLGNAVKYSAGATPPRITVSARTEAQDVVLEVRDNGVGFDPRYADKLFGVFQRLHRAEEFEGSGIGLANVRRIVTRHGGRVWAESELGQGAAFFVSLPSYVKSPEAEVPAAEVPAAEVFAAEVSAEPAPPEPLLSQEPGD
ncbi:CHASE domain-containing protein [Deinococcus sp.]|uniref:CHASE domain-containing protein n=1 Tax=Deinococcus sp. TaxID=47478 RepID=UPI0025EB46A6|nr:CHASE domain-containing protein [Deinococcus sp.]